MISRVGATVEEEAGGKQDGDARSEEAATRGREWLLEKVTVQSISRHSRPRSLIPSPRARRTARASPRVLAEDLRHADDTGPSLMSTQASEGGRGRGWGGCGRGGGKLLGPYRVSPAPPAVCEPIKQERHPSGPIPINQQSHDSARRKPSTPKPRTRTSSICSSSRLRPRSRPTTPSL